MGAVILCVKVMVQFQIGISCSTDCNLISKIFMSEVDQKDYTFSQSPVLEQLRVTERCNPAKQLTEPCPSSSSLTVHSMLPFTVTWEIVWFSDHRTTETLTSDFTLDLKPLNSSESSKTLLRTARGIKAAALQAGSRQARCLIIVEVSACYRCVERGARLILRVLA
ncbi:hypothetical protein D623_10018332 [Myotis brandtii]|uniref:Uncharacterized protein n=1 Tax=Myotis brandtii TaxID=109478 RepID=S7MSV6_MYOBR|nr:hypothetical protein D623_10018332 [Myotis brandtii]